MKPLVLLLFLTSAMDHVSSSSDEDVNEWKNFKLKFNKAFKNEVEDEYRMKIFMNNKRKIDEHNKLFEQGIVSFKMGMNQFASVAHREYVKWLNNQVIFFHNATRKKISFPRQVNVSTLSPVYVPYAIDWRLFGAVTPVKYANPNCLASWAFSATGALEAMNFRLTGRLIPLSEQNLIDCSHSFGTHGCAHGDMIHAFQYVRDNGGIASEYYYPYEGKEDRCRYNRQYASAYLTDIYSLPAADEIALQRAVGKHGPISVAVDASLPSFLYYKGGLYKDVNCGQYLNHALLVVGYNYTVDNEPYWLVKNSWGTAWGENGYIKIARNLNLCGIANAAVFPTVVR